MSERYEVRFSGSGGQGIILAGVILAEAACLYEKKNAIQTQSYGPEARGGASKSEVVISDSYIDYPKTLSINTLICLTQEACNTYSKDLSKGGILIVDSDMVQEIPDKGFKVYKLPFLKTAAENVGKAFVINIVALGSLIEITKVVSKEAIEKAVLARVPRGTESLNKKALSLGFEIAKGNN
jgi:2-oxoglutarate ferredoxin oxidoreductase subunit gamma